MRVVVLSLYLYKMNIKDFRHKIFAQSERIYPMIVRMLGSDRDAQDAIQEIMIKLWNCRKQLDEHPNPPAFVFLTARNYCLDVLRKRKSLRVSDIDLLGTEQTNNGHQQFELAELIHAIEQILSQKSPQQREILLLRDVDGLRYEEIASIMNLNVEHIRVILSRARKYVQQQLRKNYSYE